MTNRIKLSGSNPDRVTIDLTPTFEEATAIALAVIEATNNEQAKAQAREELFRYARELDRLTKGAKA